MRKNQKANIKISSDELKELKQATREPTGQKAVQKAIVYFLREARQRDLVEFLSGGRFKEGYNPKDLRDNER